MTRLAKEGDALLRASNGAASVFETPASSVCTHPSHYLSSLTHSDRGGRATLRAGAQHTTLSLTLCTTVRPSLILVHDRLRGRLLIGYG